MKTELSSPHQLTTKVSRKELFIPWVFVLMWSSGAILVELGLPYADPFTFLAYRFFIAAIIMWIISLKLKSKLPSTTFEWKAIISTGIFQQVGYQAFFFLALDFNISPGLLAIILGAQPIVTTVLSKGDTTKKQWIGLFSGMIGLILVVGHSLWEGSISILGVVWCLLSLGSITCGTFLQKNIKTSLPMNMSIQYTCSFLLFIIIAPFFGSFTVDWTSTFLMSLLWMVFIITVGATMLLYYMISKGNLTNVTSLFYCVPALTAILDYFIFGNTLGFTPIIGLGFIIMGLVMINQKNKEFKKTVAS
ncbi:DMT family transporter (plasmid) [Priestia megaterium]|uniref:DMT family transporter n=1 Tax=Priestia megaterium TaxID=1404 RepID=UPI00196AFD42|nr:DMT family transporter [Priestia megaterium]QSF36486.1 DMT family transporter [Priestia megaterium]